MLGLNSTRASVKPPSGFVDEAGNALIEFVAWLSLAALPLLLVGIHAFRAEQHFAAAQAMAREAARLTSLGHPMDASAIAGDFGVDASRFETVVGCVGAGPACEFQQATVRALDYPAMPIATAIFLVQAP